MHRWSEIRIDSGLHTGLHTGLHIGLHTGRNLRAICGLKERINNRLTRHRINLHTGLHTGLHAGLHSGLHSGRIRNELAGLWINMTRNIHGLHAGLHSGRIRNELAGLWINMTRNIHGLHAGLHTGLHAGRIRNELASERINMSRHICSNCGGNKLRFKRIMLYCLLRANLIIQFLRNGCGGLLIERRWIGTDLRRRRPLHGGGSRGWLWWMYGARLHGARLSWSGGCRRMGFLNNGSVL